MVPFPDKKPSITFQKEIAIKKTITRGYWNSHNFEIFQVVN